MMAIQEQRDYGIALFEKIRFDRASAEKFYGIFREQYNPGTIASRCRDRRPVNSGNVQVEGKGKGAADHASCA